MNIGIILDSHFPPDPRVENEALTLLNAGHKVILYCLDYTGKFPESEIYKGIKVIRHQFSNLVYKLSALAYTVPFYHLILNRSISKFLKTYQIEAVHVNDIQISRAVFWANKKSKLPIILDLHENRPEIMKYYSHVNSRTGKLLIKPNRWKRFEEKSIKKSTKTIVVTKEAKEYYLKNYNINSAQIAVVPNTVRKDFYTEFSINDSVISKFKDTYNILYIGDTGLRRGLMTVLKAVKLLIPNIPNLKIIIVGKSKTDYVLKQFVSDNEIEKYLSFEGWQNPDTFQSYISISNICISPLHKNIHHDTTYANKIFQYMALAKPLIVSNCDAQENIIKKARAGLIFKNRNSFDFADKTEFLYKNRQQAEIFGKNGQEFIKAEFNWEKTSLELINIYQNLQKMNFSKQYSYTHQKRFENTLEFLKKHIKKNDNILDLGVENPFSKYLKEQGFKISNTAAGQDLDLNFEIVKSADFDTVTAFEIFEHLVNPFSILKNIKARKLVASVPLRLWFAPAYWSQTDPFDRHYHEFETRQFDMLLDKAGWEIKDSQKWKSYNPKAIGIRPILRRFTDRYYIVYCERK